mmetsp:Transcript_35657/g.40507  ORF Transcript_35657/g.40507 Transcript_35657/m.40507 type:complete len:191 (+) Transcript_35657:154-726(+)
MRMFINPTTSSYLCFFLINMALIAIISDGKPEIPDYYTYEAKSTTKSSKSSSKSLKEKVLDDMIPSSAEEDTRIADMVPEDFFYAGKTNKSSKADDERTKKKKKKSIHTQLNNPIQSSSVSSSVSASSPSSIVVAVAEAVAIKTEETSRTEQQSTTNGLIGIIQYDERKKNFLPPKQQTGNDGNQSQKYM